jgi:hypothetical protein
MDKVQFCCDAFKKLIPTFQWMTFAEGEQKGEVFLMPHIEVDGTKYRVNHCPVCGKEVRSIEIPKDVLEEIANERD